MTFRPALLAPFALSVFAAFASVGCDEKKPDAPNATPSASATAPTTATTSAAPMASAEPAPSVSAKPAASAQGSTKDPMISVLDPKGEPQKTLKAQAGGTVTLYLPQWAGTSWSVKDAPKPLGKPKTETLPGFAGPGTPGASFVWTLKDPSLKPGQTLKATLENKSSADKTAAPTPFALTIEIVGS